MTIISDLDRALAGMRRKPRYIRMGLPAIRALAAACSKARPFVLEHSEVPFMASLPDNFRGIPIVQVPKPMGEASALAFHGWCMDGA